ncbi:disulfide bond formation protein B [Roseibium sp. RKSG952]|nr:disulfide bond formation protein B [Roseibium sp. RKSG952]
MGATAKGQANAIAALLILAGLVAIGTAWGFELIGGYAPCKLCLEQRVPYYIGLPLALASLYLSLKGRSGLAALGFVLVAAVFAYGGGLGVYQSGAEWGFWAGPSDCGGGAAAPASAADMLSALQTTRVVSCTEASWRFLGLSFAGWNAFVSGGLAVLGLIAALLSLKARKARVA